MKKNYKGFTLIEIIIVIAILAILAAILIPQFTGFQEKARSAQVIVDAKNLATALDSFHAEKGAWPTTDDEKNEVLTLAGLRVSNANVQRNSQNINVVFGENGGFSLTENVGDATTASWVAYGRADGNSKVEKLATAVPPSSGSGS